MKMTQGIISNLAQRLHRHVHTEMLLWATLLGFLAGLGSILFKKIILFIQTHTFGSDIGNLAEIASQLPWYTLLLIPSLGGLAVGVLTVFFAPEAKGHGVPEVMNAVVLTGGRIRPRVAIVKMLSSALSIGTGGSVGREGPIVQIGAAIGSFFGQIAKLPPRTIRIFVGCGAAAGISATFDAPIAGAIFALEVILGDFGIEAFTPIIFSSVIGSVTVKALSGGEAIFGTLSLPYQLVSPWEIITYSFLGIMAGFIGLLFSKSIYYSEDLFNKFTFVPSFLKPCLGGLMLGGLACFFPHVLGVGYETIGEALQNNLPLLILLSLIVCKIVATSIALGSGWSGGILAPSLFIGSMVGGVIGTFMHNLFPNVTATPGAYALVGMGALVAATTQAPLSAIIILFELTNDYSIILPLMVACVVANNFSDKFSRTSIYTEKLYRRGIDLKEGRELNILRSVSVKEVMETHIQCITEQTDFSKILKVLSLVDYITLPVVDDKKRLVGIVSLSEIKRRLESKSPQDLVIADVIVKKVITVFDQDTLFDVYEKTRARDITHLPVLSKETHKFVGMISRYDALSAYNKALLHIDI